MGGWVGRGACGEGWAPQWRAGSAGSQNCPPAYPPAPRAAQHCAGINSVVLSEPTQQLWTASRDSLVKRCDTQGQTLPPPAPPGAWCTTCRTPGRKEALCSLCASPFTPPCRGPNRAGAMLLCGCRWSLASEQPALQTSYEGHVDWVNDVALLGDLLVSCSSDRTLRVWSAQGVEGERALLGVRAGC